MKNHFEGHAHWLAVALLSLAAPTAHAQATKFDGDWKVTMVCPPHNAASDDAKGYTHRFPARVLNGELTAVHGKQGEPGWHYLRGNIQSNGEALLRLDGIVNNQDYAINNAARGKSYTYRVKAQFEESSGTGQRLTGRECEFRFNR